MKTKDFIMTICFLSLLMMLIIHWWAYAIAQAEETKENWIVFNDPTADLSVSVDEIIEVLEKARPYIWNELPQSMTLEFDPCTIDPICMAQRQVERMIERKAIREKIDRILKILK